MKSRRADTKKSDPRERWSKISPHSQPIFQTSVFDYPDLETLDDYYNGLIPRGYIYSRNGLPNSNELGRKVASLEKMEDSVVCSSGMGALLVALLSNLGKGDHVVASSDLYGGTTVLLDEELSRFGIKTSFVDTSQSSSLELNIIADTKLILVETISNPTMKVCDIKRVASLSHARGAMLLVDNTFATPFVVRPSESGADIVMHSGTKFMGGHGDLTIGVLCGGRKEIKRASQFCTRAGVIAGPFDCWLSARSVGTWALRVRRACDNALKLARYLEGLDNVARVYYPGLASHPQHSLAKRMFRGGAFGGMLSFDIKGGISSASRFVKSLKLITLTPSLGGIQTTISHPGKTSHRHVSDEQKIESGITDSMIRVSVGIEDYELIEKDIARAFKET